MKRPKLHNFWICEYNEDSSMYGEQFHPFESDQPFDWFRRIDRPTKTEVRQLLEHLEYDTDEMKIIETGIRGTGVKGKNLDIAFGFSDR